MRRSTWLAALALLGCMTTKLAPYAPTEKKSELPPERLYTAAESVLLDRGFLIAERSPEKGTLTTEQRTLQGDDVMSTEFRYTFSVQTQGGALRVEMTCSRGSKSAPEPCGQERPAKLLRDQEHMVEEILKQASQAPEPAGVEGDAGAADAG